MKDKFITDIGDYEDWHCTAKTPVLQIYLREYVRLEDRCS